MSQSASLPSRQVRFVLSLARWFDSWAGMDQPHSQDGKKIEWLRCLPFLWLHVMCLGVIWVGWSWTAVGVAFALYVIRMFAVTAIYHRYFSHRTYKTTRWCQFALAVLGASAVQRGPLWWAAHHRHHHLYSDKPQDVHSPIQHGFFMSHMGWIMTPASFLTNLKAVPDLAKFPELRFLDRFDTLVPILLGTSLFGLGAVLERVAPGLGTTGGQMLIWGFFISTVVLFHGTQTINSLAHMLGEQRYDTGDASRNSFILALITLGEGWHNNHHHYPTSTRQGFYWWEIDLSYYGLVVLSWTGLIWDLKPVPDRIRAAKRLDMEAVA